ncbi:phage protease [Laribacter hongkongensis]|uniref:phage protease n=1 Tax=Laribacter hongkongensis TaxID=168471 RepID=UPI001EFDEE19|nr:phage protease [Laribacter hongkongensis]MCG9040426.1 phage protease [Laribacter hongkongensis]MCG9067080.1 phage protease [Laribacter hongkongensis]
MNELTGPVSSFRILPAGLFRAADGRPTGCQGWFIDARIANGLIAEAARRSNDYVLDYEHQTMLAEKNGKPAPAAGWFKRLEWRDDGLYVMDARWTDTARQAILAREYRYVSPVFTFDPVTGHVQRLVNVAITNHPALDGLTDLAALRRAEQPGHKSQMAPAGSVIARVFGGAV